MVQVKKQPLNAACFTIQLIITYPAHKWRDRVDRDKVDKDTQRALPPLNYNCRLPKQPPCTQLMITNALTFMIGWFASISSTMSPCPSQSGQPTPFTKTFGRIAFRPGLSWAERMKKMDACRQTVLPEVNLSTDSRVQNARMQNAARMSAYRLCKLCVW